MADNADAKLMLDAFMERLMTLEQRLNIRLYRIESEVKLVYSQVCSLRTDFAESLKHPRKSV